MSINQEHFNQTMTKTETVLDKTKIAAEMAKDSLDELTGAGSFPVCVATDAGQ